MEAFEDNSKRWTMLDILLSIESTQQLHWRYRPSVSHLRQETPESQRAAEGPNTWCCFLATQCRFLGTGVSDACLPVQ